MNVNRKIGIKIGIFWLFFCFPAMRSKLCDKNGTVKGLRKVFEACVLGPNGDTGAATGLQVGV